MVVTVAVLGFGGWRLMGWGQVRRAVSVLNLTQVETYKVEYVIDGDTVVVDTGEKIRFLGIDTPEIHGETRLERCLAARAKHVTEKLVGGRKIYARKDVRDIDKYGRLLRFIFSKRADVDSLERSVNYKLVRAGYAKVLTIPPDVVAAGRFVEAQNQAVRERKGLWGKDCRAGAVDLGKT
ncbi:MAG: hypothetical protein GXP43_01820 [bacterium]|nr:hypothetical protein [bacterium]